MALTSSLKVFGMAGLLAANLACASASGVGEKAFVF